MEGLAVADDGGALFGDQFQFVDGALGADFVGDADEGVGDGDEDKEEVFVRADEDNHHREDEVDEVENGEGVSQDNSADGVGGFSLGFVDFALPDFCCHLLG